MQTVTTGGGTKVTTKYTYDDNGNIISKVNETIKQAAPNTTGSVTVSKVGQGTNKDAAFYEYDQWNRLAKTVTGNQTVACMYNGDGQRVEKSVNGQVTRYLHLRLTMEQISKLL